MSDNILSAVLTFSLLAGGSAAIGSEMFSQRAPAMPVVTLPTVTVVAHREARLDVVTLPTVTIVARRDAPLQVVTLPQVEITGHRDATRVAFETQASEPQRVQ